MSESLLTVTNVGQGPQRFRTDAKLNVAGNLWGQSCIFLGGVKSAHGTLFLSQSLDSFRARGFQSFYEIFSYDATFSFLTIYLQGAMSRLDPFLNGEKRPE
jgi:TctA family transporter